MTDLGEVLKELQGLTEIEEMLIARVFPVMSVTDFVEDNLNIAET